MYKKYLQNWALKTNERQKLQWTYAGIAIAGLVAAGIVGLVNMSLAQNILQIVTVSFGLFIANFVVWALIRAFIEEPPKPTETHLPTQKPARLAVKK